MQLPIGNENHGLDFWRQHVRRLAEFSGSRQRYADLNNISVSKLTYYHEKFSKPSKFSKVVAVNLEPESDKKISHGMLNYPQARLPDAAWLSTLIRELMR